MITLDEFIDLVGNLTYRLNEEQEAAIRHPTEDILQIVAGPGAGKTSVLLVRALRLVFVEGILPENILITTFTKKAARDIRSRWLTVGENILAAVSEGQDTSMIDLNRCPIGTLDSLIQQVLNEYRPLGTTAPTVLARPAADLMLRRRAFSNIYRDHEDTLDNLLSRYTFDGQAPSNQGEALARAKELIHRLKQDRANIVGYRARGEAEDLIITILEQYEQRSIETNSFDFTLLEEQLLNRLNAGELAEWVSSIRGLLIDEYQDTNPLQEAIYFSIVNSTNPSTTLVGDDDQALYRFRGGSVELFTTFEERCFEATGLRSQRTDIVRNYRSTPDIVAFYNRHITDDPQFVAGRINPPKLEVEPDRPTNGVNVLGMFRQDEETLASDLADLLYTLVDQRSYAIPGTGSTINLQEHGDLGDIAFLSFSTRERQYYRGTETERFPLKLRREMENRGMQVFNPRGQALRDIPDVQRLLGVLSLIVDPSGERTTATMPTREAHLFMDEWRHIAREFIALDPEPSDAGGLEKFINDWQSSASGERKSREWAEWPAIEIIYKLITWMPAFQNNAEHQVWLQTLMETIDSVSAESPYHMILHSHTVDGPPSVHVDRSRESLIRDGLLPLAENNEDIDEDIFPSVPRNQLQFMTIHQAKGLEFPVVIVDVGSRFTRDHPRQRFLRFPETPSSNVRQEDDIEPHLDAPLRGHRTPIDRTFDDLKRLYYVAYSRPQSVLILVGNERCLRYRSGAIPNIALGWNRDREWPWRQPYSGRRRPIAVEPPFMRI